MPSPVDVSIRELSPDLLDDYLSFFDRNAFADNPRWASCYCYFNHAPHDQKEWTKRTTEENRAAVCNLIRGGEMGGYLAHVDGRPVGWCNAGPRSRLTTLPKEIDPHEKGIGAVTCFVIAKPFRGQGIARRLLDSACEGLGRKGLEIVEAYPRQNARDAASNYHGPVSMYLAAGFEMVRELGDISIVRKRVQGSISG